VAVAIHTTNTLEPIGGEHDRWYVGPERCEEGNGVDFVDYNVEVSGELAL